MRPRRRASGPVPGPGEPVRAQAGSTSSAAGPIVCVGGLIQSLLIRVDRLPGEGETVLGSDVQEPLDGGKAVDYAVAAARLGSPVRLVTLVGTDDRGRRWRHFLEAERIATTHVQSVDGDTDVGLELLPGSKVPALLSVLGLSLGMTGTFVRRAAAAFEAAAVVVCSLEMPIDGAMAAMELGRRAGARTILNASPAQDLPRQLRQTTDVLIVNEPEAVLLAEADPAAQHAVDLAQTLRSRLGVATVVVTAGPDGAVRAGADGVREHAAVRVQDVVDTTGAGDAFVGAFAHGIRTGLGDDEACNLGIRVASIAIQRESTLPSYPFAADLAE